MGVVHMLRHVCGGQFCGAFSLSQILPGSRVLNLGLPAFVENTTIWAISQAPKKQNFKTVIWLKHNHATKWLF